MNTGIEETLGTPIIRALNVFGPSRSMDSEDTPSAQHNGFGTTMLEEAERLARVAGFERIAMNSAIGVRRYYMKRGYRRSETLMVKTIE